MTAPAWPQGRQPGSTQPGGVVYLVPSTLDFGVAGHRDLPAIEDVLPLGVIRLAARLGVWVCENAKTTRAFLKRVDVVVPLATPLQSVQMRELPRPPKGRGANGGAAAELTPQLWTDLLAPAVEGNDIGLHSEAGLPAVADPGTGLVAAAHSLGIRVVALPGASALVLALAASGLLGQSFAFVGYLPVDATARVSRIRELEALSRKLGQTQLMIETPYRNPALLSALLAVLQPGTRLAVSCGLTLGSGFNHSATVAHWRRSQPMLPADVPAVFCLLAAAG